jgi:hypothetical protein
MISETRLVRTATVACLLVTLLAAAAPAGAFRMIQNTATGRVTAGARVTCTDPGGFVHWGDSDIDWFHNTAGQGSDKAGALQAAMQTWTGVTGANHVLTYAGTTSAGFVTDSRNTIDWATGNGCSGGCLALTALVLTTGQEILETDITFNSAHTWRTNGSDYDTQAVATHELGHALGIHHTELTSTPRPTMYAYYFGTDGRTLETDDRSALQCAEDRYPTSSCSAITSASISGPSWLYLHESKAFTANHTGGQAPFSYRWSIRFHSATYGWGSWSTPFWGSQTTYASSNSCGYDRFELKVEVYESSCNNMRTAVKSVSIVNWQCPY